MTSSPILALLLLLLPTIGVRAEASAQPPQPVENEDEKQAKMNEESKQMELVSPRSGRGKGAMPFSTYAGS